MDVEEPPDKYLVSRVEKECSGVLVDLVLKNHAEKWKERVKSVSKKHYNLPVGIRCTFCLFYKGQEDIQAENTKNADGYEETYEGFSCWIFHL